MSAWNMDERERRRDAARRWSLIEVAVIAIGLWAAAMIGIAETGLLPR